MARGGVFDVLARQRDGFEMDALRERLQSESEPQAPQRLLEHLPTLQSESEPHEPHLPPEHLPKPAQSESEPQDATVATSSALRRAPTCLDHGSGKRSSVRSHPVDSFPLHRSYETCTQPGLSAFTRTTSPFST